MNPASRSLILAISLSLVLHGAALGLSLLDIKPATPPPTSNPVITATLRPPVPLPPLPELKLDEVELETPTPELKPEPPPPPKKKPEKLEKPQPAPTPKTPETQAPASAPGTLPAPAEKEARKQLAKMASQEGFYPLEAINKNWEGKVLVQIFLSPDGRVIAARTEISSGHPILDEAALKAVRALKNLPAQGMEEAFLTVTFRLE